jgi:hypothetical protein
MKSLTKSFFLLVAAVAMTVAMTGCEEALTDSNEELVPNVDGEGVPFVEFVGDETVTAAAGDTVTISLEPGEAVGEPITVEFTAAGPALASVSPSGSVTIPFDTSTTELDEADIEVILAAGAAAGESVTLELTGASTESGQTVEVGRGGTDIDRTRTVVVE